ncbi:MAG: Stk1 family PASTA domain-containing Ser/Thr kinase, partial [Antricoccus sp.]
MTEPRLFGQRYQTSSLLGYGGMAEVLLGRDQRLDRDVAVKVLRSDLARDTTFQVRFRREAQAAAALNHPAIVAVYDTGEDVDDDGVTTPYIVMEFVEGRTLRDLLKAEGVLQAAQAMAITAEICGALDFSHRNGIVHRDVKPGNVMITNSGRVKVMDFGIARAVSDSAATMTATAAVIGTAQYLSPEQARGEKVDARSDVYAVGCVLFELLTGAPPFVGDSPVAVAYQHVRENPKPPSTVNPQISRKLDSIVLKALSKNPANRYQSAAQMQEDLQRALDGKAVEATPVMTEEEATTVLPVTGFGGAGVMSDPRRAAHEEYDPNDGRPPAKTGVSKGVWAALIAVLVAAIIAAFIIIPSLSSSKTPVVKQVAVPSVFNMSVDQATSALSGVGLKLGKTQPVPSTLEQAGKVVGQTPSADAKVKDGSAVDVQVGAGPAQVQVPQIVGLSKDDANKALTGANLKATFENFDGAQPTGSVIKSSPAQGDKVPEGSTVTVFISTGQVALPGVVNQTKNAAIAALNAAGFNNVNVTAADSTAPKDQVIAQDPPANQKIAPSNTITLTVSSGQAPPPPPVAVPNVVGMTQQAAIAILKGA